MDEIIYNLEIKITANKNLSEYYSRWKDYEKAVRCQTRATLITKAISLLKEAENLD